VRADSSHRAGQHLREVEDFYSFERSGHVYLLRTSLRGAKADEAIILSLRSEMDCFASLAMTKCEGPVVVAMARLLLLMARHAALLPRAISFCLSNSERRRASSSGLICAMLL